MSAPSDVPDGLGTVVDGVGGPENITDVTADHTRTNVWLRDATRIDHRALRGARVRGFLVGPRHLQLVTGARTAAVATVLDHVRHTAPAHHHPCDTVRGADPP